MRGHQLQIVSTKLGYYSTCVLIASETYEQMYPKCATSSLIANSAFLRENQCLSMFSLIHIYTYYAINCQPDYRIFSPQNITLLRCISNMRLFILFTTNTSNSMLARSFRRVIFTEDT